MHVMEQKSHGKVALPAWLNGQTVAILGVVVALGTMTQTSLVGLRTDMNQMRQDLNADIGKLDDRLCALEIDVAAIRAGLGVFDPRLPAVEPKVRADTALSKREGD